MKDRSEITKSKLKLTCKQQWINLEMQRQTNTLNLFAEYRLQLFNMKNLFYFKFRISAGMIENLQTKNITLIPTPFRSTEMFKNVGFLSRKIALQNFHHTVNLTTKSLFGMKS